ncbi:hypothetical protein GOP47_0009899 [Adiantum capillus-veneris]|uniref:DYW domain-containing protein n=1 Tax=Adiantum capillus-veneris TaxID=13818 RepID=A0A9D4UXG8_ADICA|nr:hypothetical protein GOP47_0009899 [Adiantum capillus-veneris]
MANLYPQFAQLPSQSLPPSINFSQQQRPPAESPPQPLLPPNAVAVTSPSVIGVTPTLQILHSAAKNTATINLWQCPPDETDLKNVSPTFLSYNTDFCSGKVRDCSSRVEEVNDSLDSLSLKSNLTISVQIMKSRQNEGKHVSNDILCHLVGRCMEENNLAAGRDVYSLIVGSGLESDASLGNCVVRMLTYFEEFKEANEVFSKLVKPDVITWTAILSANVKLGDYNRAIDLYREMVEARVKPDGHVFVEVLKACMGTATERHTQQIHASIIEHGLEHDAFVGSSLVGLYVKSGTFQDVSIAFCRLPNRNTVTWSTLMFGCIYHKSGKEVPELFEQMQQEGAEPDKGTYVCLLAAASDTEDLEQGRQVHNQILVCGASVNSYVGNALVDMYVKCGCVEDAQVVFDSLFSRDVVTWSSLLLGYAEEGRGQVAFQLFDRMQQEGVVPNEVTHINILKACSVLEQGHLVHEYMITHGSLLNVQVGTALIDMYLRCGSVSGALFVFTNLSQKNVITWSTMIAGCVEFGLFDDALDLLQSMQDQGIEPNEITFLSLLKACSLQGSIEHGRQLHTQATNSGLGSRVAVGNALIDMYATCHSLEDARVVFQRMPNRDVVSWTSMLKLHAHHESLGPEGIQVFQQMKQDGIEPNPITYGYVLKLMSRTAAIEQGRQIHAYIVETGIEFNELIINALLDLYANCGGLMNAFVAFQRTQKKNVSNWSALLMGCAQHRDYSSALGVFSNMLESGLKPDGVVFLCLLSACKLVSEGCQLMKSMRDDHGILPTLEHQNSMVDILGHAGYLDEAEDLLECNPSSSNAVGWTSLLHACKVHIDVDTAKRCFNNVVVLDPKASSAFVLMSSVYSHAGMLHSGEELEARRRKEIGWKKLAHSCIEVDNEVHNFRVGDKLHCRSADIYAKLDALNVQLKKEGYAPRVDLVLGPMSKEKKEEALCGHSEKLAIAFGLISLPHGMTIRVSKNLRMCGDCHNTSKLISRIEKRDIFVNDTYGVHRFSEGVCSCDDYCYQIFKGDVLQVKR